MKLGQLIVASAILITALSSHAALLANIDSGQVRAGVAAQQAAGQDVSVFVANAVAIQTVTGLSRLLVAPTTTLRSVSCS